MQLDLLNDAHADHYESFLAGQENVMIYASWRYRQLLSRVLDAEPFYLLAMDAGGDIAAALPSFITPNDEYGPVLNSLPFFGSYGGVIQDGNDPKTCEFLLEAFLELASNEGCSASTIIVSPLDRRLEIYENHVRNGLTDHRIGQITFLPEPTGDVEDKLMSMYEGGKRTDIRRAIKAGVKVSVDNSPEAMSYLVETHEEGMRSIGGRPKPRDFFSAVQEVLKKGEDYKIYLADLDGEPISALLLMLYNSAADYFIPVTTSLYRTLQPMSLIIHRAMHDAASEGRNIWNWGGTWASQNGVYNFKKKWGTTDIPYRYCTRLHKGGEILKSLTPGQLTAFYPWFYVLPFTAARTEQSENSCHVA